MSELGIERAPELQPVNDYAMFAEQWEGVVCVGRDGTPTTPDPRCATCRHWENPWTKEEGSGPINYGFGVPSAEDRPRWGTCTRIGMACDSTQLGDAAAFVIDGSQYAADLHVRDDFGCVLHEVDA